jgi:hypothetical protein
MIIPKIWKNLLGNSSLGHVGHVLVRLKTWFLSSPGRVPQVQWLYGGLFYQANDWNYI